MARRRMLDPSFFDDTDVSKLTRDERLFLLGCIRNADDEGRLNGHPAYLKAEIFMYDEDINLDRMHQLKESTLEKMKNWRSDNLWRLNPYRNSDQDYLHFPNWYQQQRPSHPTPSKLPTPPEALPKSAGETRKDFQQPSEMPREEVVSSSPLGQSSQVKSSLVQSSGVQEDFTKFLNEKDLTDFLTTTLEKYMPRGPSWLVEVLHQFWRQTMGQPMADPIFGLTAEAVKKYPPPVLATAYVKTVKYGGGKHGSWRYLDKVLKEKAEKGEPSE